MANKKLSPLSTPAWTIREVLDPGTAVSAVTCHQGGIVSGGAHLYRIPPGSWDVQYRGLPEGTEMPISIAIEPRPPHRIAIGPESGDVVVFTDTTNGSSIIGHAFSETRGAKQARELCWVVHEGQSWLFARTDDLELYRMAADGWDTLEIPPVHAIASDHAGNFAALTVVDGAPKVYISTDGGAEFAYRDLEVDIEVAPDAPAFLALAGEAVVAGVGDSGPLLSRGPGVPTVRYPTLDRACSAAFTGSSPRGWIYVAQKRRGPTPAEIWVVDGAGETLKVMDFLADDDRPLDLGPIVWDDVRGALLVSSRGGLLAMGPKRPAAARRPRTSRKPVLQ